MLEEKNGPYMLVLGLLFGVGGVIGIIWWIKKNIADQENALFGAENQSKRNDAFIRMSKEAGVNDKPLSTTS